MRDSVCVDLQPDGNDVGYGADTDTGPDTDPPQPDVEQPCEDDSDCSPTPQTEWGSCVAPQGVVCAETGQRARLTIPRYCNTDFECANEEVPIEETEECPLSDPPTDCDDGLSCTPQGSCSSGACEPGTPHADRCLIDGQCYSEGDENPDNQCQFCDPIEHSRYEWAQDSECVISQIDAGGFHTCGVASNHDVHCWGLDEENQASPPLGSFVQVSAGAWHSCGVDFDERIQCWGSDESGQQVDSDDDFWKVTAGGAHTCARHTDGVIECWGELDSPASSTVFSDLSSGSNHACGLRFDNTIECWGSDSDGQTDAPTGSFVQLSAGDFHTCAIDTSGNLDCWGFDGDGQATAPSGSFSQVSAGGFHSCAIGGDSELECWGSNSHGQSDPPSGSFSSISAGRDHSCAIDHDGQPHCWGRNNHGQATIPN